jgi:ribosomal protein L24E
MKKINSIVSTSLLAGIVALTALGCKTRGHDEYNADMKTSSAKAYPMDKCVVSGEALEPGKTYTFVRNGQEVKLCCKDCLAEFNKNPDKFMAQINNAK